MKMAVRLPPLSFASQSLNSEPLKMHKLSFIAFSQATGLTRPISRLSQQVISDVLALGALPLLSWQLNAASVHQGAPGHHGRWIKALYSSFDSCFTAAVPNPWAAARYRLSNEVMKPHFGSHYLPLPPRRVTTDLVLRPVVVFIYRACVLWYI